MIIYIIGVVIFFCLYMYLFNVFHEEFENPIVQLDAVGEMSLIICASLLSWINIVIIAYAIIEHNNENNL